MREMQAIEALKSEKGEKEVRRLMIIPGCSGLKDIYRGNCNN